MNKKWSMLKMYLQESLQFQFTKIVSCKDIFFSFRIWSVIPYMIPCPDRSIGFNVAQFNFSESKNMRFWIISYDSIQLDKREIITTIHYLFLITCNSSSNIKFITRFLRITIFLIYFFEYSFCLFYSMGFVFNICLIHSRIN